MAFPTIPTAGASTLLQTNQATATTTHTFPSLSDLPNTPGALLLAVIVCYQGGSTNAEFSAWGGGFTELVDQSANSATIQSIGAARILNATGSESGTFTVTTVASTRSVMFLMEIPGAHASTLPEATAKANGTTAAADPAALDPANWAAEDTLWIAVAVNGEISLTGSFTGITAAPTNYTDYAQSGIIGGDVIGALEGAVAFRQLNTASENVGTFTLDVGAAGNSALLIAVRPAPVPVTGTALGAYTFGSAGSGEAGVVGSTTADFTFGSTGSGEAGVVATALGAFAFTGEAQGVVTGGGVTGTAVGDFTFGATATGVPDVQGQALAGLTFGATAQGETGVVGQTVATITFGPTSQGVAGHDGAAVGAFAFTGAASGQAAGAVQGQGLGAYTFGPTATGQVGHGGAGLAQLDFLAQALGTTGRAGTGLAALTFGSTSLGQTVAPYTPQYSHVDSGSTSAARHSSVSTSGPGHESGHTSSGAVS